MDSAVDSAAAAPASSSQTSHRTIRVSRTSSPPPRTRRTPPRLRRSVFARLRLRRARRAPSLHSTIASRLPHRPIQTMPTTTTTPHARRARSRPRPRRHRTPPRASRPRPRAHHPNNNLHAHRHRFRARRHRFRATSFDTSPPTSSSLSTTTRARSRTTPSSVARTNECMTPPHRRPMVLRRVVPNVRYLSPSLFISYDEYTCSVFIQESSHTQHQSPLCLFMFSHTHARTHRRNHTRTTSYLGPPPRGAVGLP